MTHATLALTATLTLIATTALADPVGLIQKQQAMPHHDGTKARISIFYPANATGEAITYASNPVFQGVAVHPDAPPAIEAAPVVLFSHGMGGTTRAQAWLATALAAKGAIVVGVDHPNGTFGDFDMAEGVKHWTRAQDLSAALDELMTNPDFGPQIDPTRIMAAGFSFGGWTALSLGGVTGNLNGSVAACVDQPEMSACDVLMSDAVNLPGQDPDLWSASYADPRVTDVVAIDPGFVWGLSAENVASLTVPIHLIGFGAGDNRMQATNFDASGLASLLPAAKITQIAPAFHFTAMPLCTEIGAAILAEENDDPVCTDPAGTNRAAVHDHIVTLMADQLGL